MLKWTCNYISKKTMSLWDNKKKITSEELVNKAIAKWNFKKKS